MDFYNLSTKIDSFCQPKFLNMNTQSCNPVVNQAGLSKDNFLDSESTCAAARRDSQGGEEGSSSSSSQGVNKITDYFSSRYSL